MANKVQRFFANKMTFRHFIWTTIAAGSVGVTSIAWILAAPGGAKTAEASDARSSAAAGLPVSVLIAKKQFRLEHVTRFTGEIRARRVAEMGFERGGRVATILVDDGQLVSARDVIATLDTRILESELKQLQAQHRGAIARWNELENGARQEQLDAMRANVAALTALSQLAAASQQRKSGLVGTRAISKEEYDAAKYAADAAEARRREAEFNLLELETGPRLEQKQAQEALVQQLAASVEEVQTHLEKSTLRAPFAGVVQRRHLDEGTMVDVRDSVVTLQEQGELEAWVGVGVAAALALELSNAYELEINGQVILASIKTILPALAKTTRTRTVIFRLPDTNPTYVPGELIALRQKTETAAEGYWLPQESLVSSGQGLWNVLVVEADGVLGKREIEVIHVEDDTVFVRGTLQEGDQVVANGVHRLVTGQKVASIVSTQP
jgi:multidrug efflux pump subunit AcrA (membrane-fusion protein)